MFVDSGAIYDLGLYSTVELAVSTISLENEEFAALCNEPDTVVSLAQLISEEEDSFLNFLMRLWYNYLLTRFDVVAPYFNEFTDYEPYTVKLPGGKELNGKRYTKNETPPDNYPNVNKYSSATLISRSSYHYNCVTYAWYLHGDVNSQFTKLWIDTSYQFVSKAPSCATLVNTPKSGDIVVYINENDGGETEKHSAIITSINSSTDPKQFDVVSKWGYYGTYTHKLTECPYYADVSSFPGMVPIKLEYYRISHKYILSGNYYYCTGCGYKNPVIVTVEPE